MNWLSKKLMLTQIKKYFEIEDEDQLHVSITGQQKIRCVNLKLKNQVVNKPTMLVHVHQLDIKYLEIAYDKTKDQPLKVILDGITLVLAFNPKVQKQTDLERDKQEIIQSFHEAIKKKQSILKKGHFWQSASQTQKLLLQAFIGRLSLVIKQVDVSIQYESQDEIRVIGAQLEEINIKQRMVISQDQNSNLQSHQDEIRCFFEQVSIYLGIYAEEDKIQSKQRSKQIVYKMRTRKKSYLMEKNQIQLYYSISKSNLFVQIKQIMFKVSKLGIYQLSKISDHFSKYLSQRPILRPKQGELRALQFRTQTKMIHQGTLKWWQYLYDKVIEKRSKRSKSNLFTNQENKKYMFLIIYKYTFGSSKFIEQKMKEIQKKRFTKSIMQTNYSMLSKIKLIKQSKKFEIIQNHFLQFIQASQSVKQIKTEGGLKSITYQDIRKSKVTFNIENCYQFIRQSESQSLKALLVDIKSFKLHIIQYKQDHAIIQHGFKLAPTQFYLRKPKQINKYYKNIFEDPNKSFTSVLKLEVQKILVTSSRIQTKIDLPSILITREDNQIILKINKFFLSKEKKSLLGQTDNLILYQNNLSLKIVSIYLNIHEDVIRHILSIKMMMSEDITKPLTEKQEFEEYKYNNIYKRLSVHPIFQTCLNQSLHFNLQKIIMVTSTFAKNQHLTFEVGDVSIISPIRGKPRANVSKFSLSRSNLSNIERIRYSNIQKLIIQKQSILMENNKSLIINFSYLVRGHLLSGEGKPKMLAQIQKEEKKQKKEKNIIKRNILSEEFIYQQLLDSTEEQKKKKKKKKLAEQQNVSYRYFEPVMEIVVPFIIVQMSFMDLYYFQLMLNYWKQITENPYYFPKRPSKTHLQKKLVQIQTLSRQYIQKEDSFTRVSRYRCKCEGINITIFGENKERRENKILGVLLQGLILENKVYILGQLQKIKILNFFVQNSLGEKTFNINRLRDMLYNPDKEGQPLVYSSKSHQKQESSYLVLYGNTEEVEESKQNENTQKNLIQIIITNRFDLKILKKQTLMDVSILPLFLYQQPGFYKILKYSGMIIYQAAKANYKPKQVLSYKEYPQQFEEHQILQAKNIYERFELKAKIPKFNILALHNTTPIFTISLLRIQTTIHTQLYLVKYHIKSEQFYIVDISPFCGLYPIIMKSKQMNCHFVQYQSELLKQKQNKSAFLSIDLNQAQTFYLNRKMMELTNFFKSHFQKKQPEDQAEMNEIQTKKNQIQYIRSYPFSYQIRMIKPIITLIRNSLSNQKFVGQGSDIMITNIEQSINKFKNEKKENNSIIIDDKTSSAKQQGDISFQSCQEIGENKQQTNFYAFNEEGKKKQQKEETIFVNLSHFKMYSQKEGQSLVISINSIDNQLIGKKLVANVQDLQLILSDDDYRLLIRITQQNFSQVPVSFPNDSSPSQVKTINFQTNYKVSKLSLILKKQYQVFGEMTIQSIAGKNILYSTGQQLNEISLESMNYLSLYKNELTTIIKMKNHNNCEQSSEKKMKKNQDNNGENSQKNKRSQKNCDIHFQKIRQNQYIFDITELPQKHKPQFQHQNQDLLNLDSFFTTENSSLFKFGQKDIFNHQKRKAQNAVTQVDEKQEKKLEKVGKWFGGMCQKCLCCFKKKQERRQEKYEQNELIKNKSSKMPLQQQMPLQKQQDDIYIQESYIQNELEMKKFSKKVKTCEYHKKQITSHPIYMHIIGEKNKQKRMYALVQNLIIYYQSKQLIMQLINFMNKPYAYPQKPQYVRNAKFNNFPPFQMVMELTNTSMEAIYSDFSGSKSIVIDLDMIYNFEKQGDQQQGPGKLLMQMDMLCQMKYVSKLFTFEISQNKQKKIPLSKSIDLSSPMRIIWSRQTKTTFHYKQPKTNKQTLYMVGYKKIQKKEGEKNTFYHINKNQEKINPQPIIFYLPVSYLKQLNDLIQNMFRKKEDSQNNSKALSKENMQRKSSQNQKSGTLAEQPEQLLFQKPKPREPDMQTEKLEFLKYQKEQIKASIQNIYIQKYKSIKIYFIPQLKLEILTSKSTSYLTSNLENLKYHLLEGNKPFMNAQIQTISLECNVDYLNLNLVKFQPFLEKANLNLLIENYKIQDNENKYMKLYSKAEKDPEVKDYRKGLSVNLSTALYHTIKQLQLKYELGNAFIQKWEDKCFNLSTNDTSAYNIMLKRNQNMSEYSLQDKRLVIDHPADLKNFFGKRFIVDNKNQLSKKKNKRKGESKHQRFHKDNQRVFLYHSFIENNTKLKNVIYRTPFRFLNQLSQKYSLELSFKTPNRNQQWSYEINYKEYYCLPADIYEGDFLMRIYAHKKNRETSAIKPLQRHISVNNMGMNIRQNSINDQVKVYESWMSVKYLSQINAKISDYQKLGKNKFHEYLFNTSNLQTRYVDRRDILIRSKDATLVIVNIKSDCEEVKDSESDKKMTFYDSLTIIMSPIIIFNYTGFNLGISICRKSKIQIRTGKKTEINHLSSNFQFKDVTLQFAEDILHHEYRFFDPHFQVDAQKKSTVKKILIDRMQSLNVKITKQTYSTCIIQIFPDWVIMNKTEMQFQLYYNKQEFPIDKNSASSLAVESENVSNKSMKIKLYDNRNPNEKFHKLVSQTQTLDIFTLVKVDEKSFELQNKKQAFLSRDVGCCGIKGQRLQVSQKSKRKDEKIYRCIEFVVSIFDGSQYEQTKQLVINYKYEITNSMHYKIQFYQSTGTENPYLQNNRENQSLILFDLQQHQAHYLYSFDFLPKIYFIVVIFENQERYTSNYFTCDAKTGQSFSLKLKSQSSSASEVKFVRVDLNQSNYTNELSFKYIDDKQVRHPFYIKNTTSYQIKITQNDNSFALSHKKESPFLWSNLIHNQHTITIQIQGYSQVYNMKQNSQFPPITIRGDKISNQFKKVQRSIYKREICRCKWPQNEGEFMVIYDFVLKQLILKSMVSTQASTFPISNFERLKQYLNKIQLHIKSKKMATLEIYPSEHSIKEWVQVLSRDIQNDVIDKIYFTIESMKNSMIFFIHNVDISSNNNLQLSKNEYLIENLFVSIIYNSSYKVEELLLINMEDIQYSTEQKISYIKEKDTQDNPNALDIPTEQSYKIKKYTQCYKVTKLKINNQLVDAVNPVILSQIKKSRFPFLQYKTQKQTLVRQQNLKKIDNDKNGIQHFKNNIFFLDEAELKIQASLLPKILYLKKFIEDINKNYRMDTMSQQVGPVENRQNKNKMKQIYINYMEIMPIKMTVSVSFQSNQAYISSKLMNFLTLIPTGVENAIIAIDSFIFHHVFLQEQIMKKTLQEYYMYEMKKQIVYNAGSIQFFAPLQIIQGLGVGFKNIFYNPLYSLVNDREIEGFTSNFLEGIISFFVYILKTGVKFINIVLKMISALTFNRQFQSKRQMFKIQIFKSPIDGLNYGGRYFLKIFMQLFTNFSKYPLEYHKMVPYLGFLIGILIAIINIVPWIIKVAVTAFDFFYVIVEGFINWGHYEQNSMKYRSRPIRTFPHKELQPYDYLTAKGNQIMRKHQIQQNDNESILFICFIDESDESRYLVLSNYRILYCTYQLLSFKQIQLYQVSTIVVKPIDKNLDSNEYIQIEVNLQFPDKKRHLCFQHNINEYQIKFSKLVHLKQFLHKLQSIKRTKQYLYTIQANQLDSYEQYHVQYIAV